MGKTAALAKDVAKHLQRLGCARTTARRMAAPEPSDTFVVLRKSDDGEWRSIGEDWAWREKASEFPTDTAVRRFFDAMKSGVTGITRAPDYDEDAPRTEVEMVSCSENYEFRRGKKRVVLYAFAYDATIQHHFALDLLDEKADPVVHRVDHDGSSYDVEGSLSDFLETLARE